MSDIGKMIKNYRTLTNKKYRIATNFIIPLASAATIRLLVHLGDIWYGLALLVFVFVMMAEMMGDYFSFGCICKKNSFGMNFLKSSFGGMHCFADALLLDILVRPFRLAVFAMIVCFPWMGTYLNGWLLFEGIVSLAIISIASLNVTRYLDTAYYLMLVASVFLAPVAGIIALLFFVGVPVKIMAVVLAVLLFLTIVLTYFHMLTRMKKSYLDV